MSHFDSDQFLKDNAPRVPEPPIGHEEEIVEAFRRQRRVSFYKKTIFGFCAAAAVFIFTIWNMDMMFNESTNMTTSEILAAVVEDYGQNGKGEEDFYSDWEYLGDTLSRESSQ